MQTVYKITDTASLAKAEDDGVFEPSDDDRRDGFVHLSTAEQLKGTLDRHFSGKSDLMLLAFDAARLGDELRWEPSRGGELFPHLYDNLPVAGMLWVEPLPRGLDGGHRLPKAVLDKIGLDA